MNQRIDAKAMNAMLGVELPGRVEPDQAPDEIMFMPPGEHTITASRGGQPVTITVNVDEVAAQAVAAAHARYMEAVTRNEEDLPYTDFNHDDQEASGHPTAFRWAGSDPQFGGIRARMQWTSKGREAIIGRSYRRFSPSFYVDAGGKISGAPVNFGGLVNRAAFTRIAPIIAKPVEEVMLASSADFYEKAKIISLARNLSLVDAINVLAREQPESYEDYRAKLYGAPRRQVAHSKRSTFVDEFVIRSQALCDSLEISFVDAATNLCREQPGLYERYRARLFDRDPDPDRLTALAAVRPSPFFIRAKSVSESRKVDLAEAFTILAREVPESYDLYRQTLIGR
jgi:hypothetical protein